MMRVMWNQIAGRVTSLLYARKALLNFCVVCEFNEPRFFVKSVNAAAPKAYRVTGSIHRGAPNVHPVLYTPREDLGERAFSYLGRLPASALDDIRTANGQLLLDASGQSTAHDSDETAALHHELMELQIPLHRAVLLTQNRAAAKRKRDKNSIKFHYCSSKLIHSAENVRRRMVETGELQERLRTVERALSQTTSRCKKFTFLDSPRRSEHTSLLLFLSAMSLLSAGHIQPNVLRSKADARPKELSPYSRHFPALNETDSNRKEIQDLRAGSLREQWQIRYQGDGLAEYTSPFHPLPPALAAAYSDSYFSIAVEPRFPSKSENLIGEDPLRPMLGLHPFLLFGFPGELRTLRDFGFETFSPYIEENYDDVIDPKERIAALLSLVEKLCGTSCNDLDLLYRELFPRLRHNCEQFAGSFQSRYREAIERPILEHLQAVSHTPALAP